MEAIKAKIAGAPRPIIFVGIGCVALIFVSISIFVIIIFASFGSNKGTGNGATINVSATSGASGNVAPTAQPDISVSEILTTDQVGCVSLGSSTVYSPNCSVFYKTTYMVNFNTDKYMTGASFTNISIQPNLSNYTVKVFAEKHNKYDDFPSGIPIADEYPDGYITYRSDYNAIQDNGKTIVWPLSTKIAPEYQGEISQSSGYVNFRIVVLDIATIKYEDLYVNNSAQFSADKMMPLAGMTKANLSATVHFTISATFNDGTTVNRPVTINIDGNKFSSDYMEIRDFE